MVLLIVILLGGLQVMRVCSLSLVSNQLRITNNDATAGGAVTSFSVVSGEVYTFSVGTSSGTVQLYLGAAPNTATYFGPVISNSTTWTSTVTGTVYFMVKNVSTTNGATVDIDHISVRLAEEDRSVNNNGVQVFGTVTKTAVATGAELVGYSGFSTSNYLLQPYNAALNFTNEFSISFWVKNWSAVKTFYTEVQDKLDNSKTPFICIATLDMIIDLHLPLMEAVNDFAIPLSGNLTGWQNCALLYTWWCC